MYNYPPFPPYPMYIYPPTPQPAAPDPDRKMNRSELKDIKKAVKFYQSILDAQGKKKDDSKDKKDEKKGFFATWGVPERAFLYTFLAPFAGVAFWIMFIDMVLFMAQTAQNFAQHIK